MTSNGDVKKCIFSMYASDGILASNYAPLRITPFANDNAVVPIKYNAPYGKLGEELKFDDSTSNIDGIYYYDVGIGTGTGSACDMLYFNTPFWKWPPAYTLALWIKWSSKINFHITFDSAGYAPITMSQGQSLGVAGDAWRSLIPPVNVNDNKRMIQKARRVCLDKWQFVIGIGGGNDCGNTHRTRFYVGDMENTPEYIGFVEADICGLDTNRIGNGFEHRQGPGPIASVQVYNCHLNQTEINDVYWESKTEIGKRWTSDEMDVIADCLLTYVHVKSIVYVIFIYVRSKTMYT